MHTGALQRKTSGGWSEHISTHDSMLVSFVSKEEGTRVGKKEYKMARTCGKGDVGGEGAGIKCLCAHLDRRVCFICLCVRVCVNHYSCFDAGRILV